MDEVMNEMTEQNSGMLEVNGVKMSVPCDKLLEALSKMQGMLDNAKKESKNPYFKSKYADLANCIDTAKKPMAECGLSLTQHCSFKNNQVQCVTILGHTSGQLIASTLNVPVAKMDAQGIGSAITYARRYSMTAVIGLTQKDDDGESSVIHEEESEEEQGSVGETDENWRVIDKDHVEIRADNGRFYVLGKFTIGQLQKALNDDRYSDIKNFISLEIEKKSKGK